MKKPNKYIQRTLTTALFSKFSVDCTSVQICYIPLSRAVTILVIFPKCSADDQNQMRNRFSLNRFQRINRTVWSHHGDFPVREDVALLYWERAYFAAPFSSLV